MFGSTVASEGHIVLDDESVVHTDGFWETGCGMPCTT